MFKGQHICVFLKSVNRNPVCLAGEDGWGRQALAPRTASSVTVAKGSKEMPKRPSGETYLPYTWSSQKKVWGKQWKEELPRLQMLMSTGRLNLLSTLRAKETFPLLCAAFNFLTPGLGRRAGKRLNEWGSAETSSLAALGAASLLELMTQNSFELSAGFMSPRLAPHLAQITEPWLEQPFW